MTRNTNDDNFTNDKEVIVDANLAKLNKTFEFTGYTSELDFVRVPGYSNIRQVKKYIYDAYSKLDADVKSTAVNEATITDKTEELKQLFMVLVSVADYNQNTEDLKENFLKSATQDLLNIINSSPIQSNKSTFINILQNSINAATQAFEKPDQVRIKNSINATTQGPDQARIKGLFESSLALFSTKESHNDSAASLTANNSSKTSTNKNITPLLNLKEEGEVEGEVEVEGEGEGDDSVPAPATVPAAAPASSSNNTPELVEVKEGDESREVEAEGEGDDYSDTSSQSEDDEVGDDEEVGDEESKQGYAASVAAAPATVSTSVPASSSTPASVASASSSAPARYLQSLFKPSNNPLNNPITRLTTKSQKKPAPATVLDINTIYKPQDNTPDTENPYTASNSKVETTINNVNDSRQQGSIFTRIAEGARKKVTKLLGSEEDTANKEDDITNKASSSNNTPAAASVAAAPATVSTSVPASSSTPASVASASSSTPATATPAAVSAPVAATASVVRAPALAPVVAPPVSVSTSAPAPAPEKSDHILLKHLNGAASRIKNNNQANATVETKADNSLATELENKSANATVETKANNSLAIGLENKSTNSTVETIADDINNYFYKDLGTKTPAPAQAPAQDPDQAQAQAQAQSQKKSNFMTRLSVRTNKVNPAADNSLATELENKSANATVETSTDDFSFLDGLITDLNSKSGNATLGELKNTENKTPVTQAADEIFNAITDATVDKDANATAAFTLDAVEYVKKKLERADEDVISDYYDSLFSDFLINVAADKDKKNITGNREVKTHTEPKTMFGQKTATKVDKATKVMTHNKVPDVVELIGKNVVKGAKLAGEGVKLAGEGTKQFLGLKKNKALSSNKTPAAAPAAVSVSVADADADAALATLPDAAENTSQGNRIRSGSVYSVQDNEDLSDTSQIDQQSSQGNSVPAAVSALADSAPALAASTPALASVSAPALAASAPALAASTPALASVSAPALASVSAPALASVSVADADEAENTSQGNRMLSGSVVSAAGNQDSSSNTSWLDKLDKQEDGVLTKLFSLESDNSSQGNSVPAPVPAIASANTAAAAPASVATGVEESKEGDSAQVPVAATVSNTSQGFRLRSGSTLSEKAEDDLCVVLDDGKRNNQKKQETARTTTVRMNAQSPQTNIPGTVMNRNRRLEIYEQKFMHSSQKFCPGRVILTVKNGLNKEEDLKKHYYNKNGGDYAIVIKETLKNIVSENWEKALQKNSIKISDDNRKMFYETMRDVHQEKLKTTIFNTPQYSSVDTKKIENSNISGSKAGVSAWEADIKAKILAKLGESADINNYMKAFRECSSFIQKDKRNIFDTENGKHYENNKGARSWRIVDLLQGIEAQEKQGIVSGDESLISIACYITHDEGNYSASISDLELAISEHSKSQMTVATRVSDTQSQGKTSR